MESFGHGNPLCLERPAPGNLKTIHEARPAIGSKNFDEATDYSGRVNHDNGSGRTA